MKIVIETLSEKDAQITEAFNKLFNDTPENVLKRFIIDTERRYREIMAKKTILPENLLKNPPPEKTFPPNQ